jgi:twitching motility protein PilT
VAGTDNNNLEALMREAVTLGGSDVHLLHGHPPLFRVAQQFIVSRRLPAESTRIMEMVSPYLNEFHKKLFQEENRANVSFTVTGMGRFRMNICRAQGTVAASIRVIPTKIYPLSDLGLPPIIATLVQKRRGIILITGATGMGKSTTMAAMLDHINHTGRPGKIVTIEDPIETLFVPVRSYFLQREVGCDTPSFEKGIEDALRQDPDVLCIGELRTPASIKAALTAAETGHLVLTTLHTPDAAKTAQRILSAFPGEHQETIRDQFCNSVEAIISQELLPRADGKGLLLAIEVLLGTSAVRQLIREGRLAQVNDALQTGVSQGMISKDASVKSLFQRQLITRETATAAMRNPQLLG